jgi:hypothetical protein
VLIKLLTAAQVAEALQIKESTVPTLRIPTVRVGSGKGLIRYKEEDVEAYVASRTRYAATYEEGHNGNHQKKKKPGQLGLSVLPSKQLLQKIRLQNSGGGQGSGDPIPS